jgi:ATP-dependent Clp endopeptidase proteolytic subunit ClpP
VPNLISFKNKHSGLTIRNKTTTSAEIVLYGAIGASWFEDSISAKQFSDMLKELPDTVTDISVRINSPGGDVFDGYTIATRLKQHKAKVTTYVDGLAASIASVIALAGDEVVMGENAQLMIHNSWTFSYGNASDFENVIERLRDIDQQLVSVYAKKTKMTRDEIKGMMDAETWISANDAVDQGFADRVAEGSIPIAASLLENAKWINKLPKNIITETDTVKKEVSGLQDKINKFLARK